MFSTVTIHASFRLPRVDKLPLCPHPTFCVLVFVQCMRSSVSYVARRPPESPVIVLDWHNPYLQDSISLGHYRLGAADGIPQAAGVHRAHHSRL